MNDGASTKKEAKSQATLGVCLYAISCLVTMSCQALASVNLPVVIPWKQCILSVFIHAFTCVSMLFFLA